MNIIYGCVVFVLYCVLVIHQCYDISFYCSKNLKWHEYFFTGINFSLLILWCIYNISKTNPIELWGMRNIDGTPFVFLSIVSYAILLWIFSLLFSVIIATIEMLLIGFIEFRNDKSVFTKRKVLDADLSMFSAMAFAYIGVGFNLVLYSFGISDIIIFEILLH